MTRGEFAELISNLIGEAEPVAGTYMFADLSVEHKNYTAIQRCVQRGYMGGSDGLIRPDDYITYIEAMTVMARVLNYADYAKNNGDYTRGYYTTAKMLGILNKLPVIGGVNRLAGALVGVGIGIVIVWILFIVVTLLYDTTFVFSVRLDFVAVLVE